MRISAGSMKGVGAAIRVAGRASMGLVLAITVAAILLGRYVEPLAGQRRVPGSQGVVRAVQIQDAEAFCRDQESNFFDPETGESVRVALPLPGGFGSIGLSPFSTGAGSRRAAGFCAVGRGEEESGTHRLVLFRVPDGSEIGRISLEMIPTSNPCWSPDGSERIVFSGFDGRLYEYRMSRSEGGPAVRRLEMRAGLSLASIGQIRDVCWPTDPRLGGRLLVTTRLPGKVGEIGNPPYQLAWLRLDPEDGSILNVEPLDRSEQRAAGERRFPTVGRSVSGGIQVAFLSKQVGTGQWHLELAEVAEGTADGSLSLVKGSARIIARNVHPTHPAFSSDGQFLTYVPVVNPALGPGAPIRMVVGLQAPRIVACR